MGMYDYVKCECELPDPEVQNEEFQTKAFDNRMGYYTITTSGVLIHHQTIWEPVPEEERPYYGKPEWKKDGFYRVAGSIRTVHVRDVEMDFHGIFHFYKSKGNDWYEYKAKFTDGQLVQIEKVNR